MHYFLSRRADRLAIGTLNLPPGSSNAIPFGAVPTHGNQIMSCFVITRLQVNPPALNNRLDATPGYHRDLRSRAHLRPLVYIQRQWVPHPPKNDAVPRAGPVDGGADYLVCAVP